MGDAAAYAELQFENSALRSRVATNENEIAYLRATIAVWTTPEAVAEGDALVKRLREWRKLTPCGPKEPHTGTLLAECERAARYIDNFLAFACSHPKGEG